MTDRGDDAAAPELELDHGAVEEARGLEPVRLDAPHKRRLWRGAMGNRRSPCNNDSNNSDNNENKK